MTSKTRLLLVLVAAVAVVAVFAGARLLQRPASAPAPAAVGVPGDATLGEGIPNAADTGASTADMTLGTLADQVNAAWAGLTSIRIVSTGSLTANIAEPTKVAATPVRTGSGATPVASLKPISYEMTRESEFNGSQRQTVSGTGSQDFEAIVVGDTVYLRGPLVDQLAPGTPEDAWIAMPVATAMEAGGLLRVLIDPLTTSPADPLAAMRDGLRPQKPRDMGPITVGGRACRSWAGADTDKAGARTDVIIAIDEQGIPCLIETRIGTEVKERITFEAVNQVTPITAPDAATPVAKPEPLEAPHAD